MAPSMGESSTGLARVARMHAQGNQRSRDGWELYREHREALTRTIDAVAERVGVQPGSASTLVLLGAGNCNDVELPVLAARFGEIHLVDIDAAAIERARQRQPPEIAARIVVHGGVDLTGLLHRLDRWKSRPPDAATLEQAVAEGVAAILARLPGGRADVAVSCCLMSQLGWSLEAALSGEGERRERGAPAGENDHETGVELRMATIAVHLRTLAGLCRSGGAALLASDIVSSDLYPLDELPAGADLKALAAELIAGQQVVYAGANPLLVSRILRRDAVARAAFAPTVVLDPWLWTGQFDRIYLVYPQLLPRL
jgi:hypothetical protein